MKTVKFKLQNLIFGSEQLPDEHFAMMYRGDRFFYLPMESAYKLSAGNFVEFFTYLNSFSYAKWKKYTRMGKLYLSLKCKGAFSVQIFGHYRENGEIKKEFFELNNYDLSEMTTISIPVKDNIKASMLGFQIAVNSDPQNRFYIEEGSWYTYIPSGSCSEVRISIATTTFKKEKYITKNVDILERELFYGSEQCKDNFRLRIIDNGRTLDPEDFNSEYVTLFPNENVGGAGGFTRGIIESLHGEEKPTHILLMDDDVIILPEALIRTYSLLALLKDEYKEHFISGAMLRAQQMNEQHEDVGYVYKEGYYRACKPVMFLHLWDQVFINDEIAELPPNSYAAWWYCCFPVSTLKENDLPLPVFIRCDDVDFSVRHKAKIITLNGIFVWHDDFKYKFSASMEYYMVMRNSLITQAIDGIYDDVDFIGHMDDVFWERMTALDYAGCELILDALEDYLKGPDFLFEPCGERIVKEKSSKNEKMRKAESVCAELKGIDPYTLTDGLYNDPPLTKKQKFWYKVTKNGHTLPEFMLKDKIAVVPCDWAYTPGRQYMCKDVLAVNPYSKTVSYRKRSAKRYSDLVKRREKLMSDLKKNGSETAAKYKEAGKTFRSEGFWRKYLGI